MFQNSIKFSLRLIQLTKSLLDACIKNNLINKDSLRYFEVELTYHEYVIKGMKPKTAREKVAEEFYIAEKTVQHIIYNKKKLK